MWAGRWLPHAPSTPHPTQRPKTVVCFLVTPAEAVVQSLLLPETEGRAFALSSTKGEGPGADTAAWRALFTSAR